MLEIEILEPSVSWSSNTYLLTVGDESLIIDPASHFDKSLIRGKLKYIFLTHGHYDHILNAEEWAENTGAPIIISSYDKAKLSDPNLNCATLFGIYNGAFFGEVKEMKGGDIFPLGRDTVRIIETPGHTEGSVSLLIGGSLFVGDTIFAGGGYGKCCFPGGDFTKIRRSIVKLLAFDESLNVYPGHGAATTIGEYKKDFLR